MPRREKRKKDRITSDPKSGREPKINWKATEQKSPRGALNFIVFFFQRGLLPLRGPKGRARGWGQASPRWRELCDGCILTHLNKRHRSGLQAMLFYTLPSSIPIPADALKLSLAAQENMFCCLPPQSATFTNFWLLNLCNLHGHKKENKPRLNSPSYHSCISLFL